MRRWDTETPYKRFCQWKNGAEGWYRRFAFGEESCVFSNVICGTQTKEEPAALVIDAGSLPNRPVIRAAKKHLEKGAVHCLHSVLGASLSIFSLAHQDLRLKGRNAPISFPYSANYLPLAFSSGFGAGKNCSSISKLSLEVYPHSTELSASMASLRLR